MVSAPFTAPYEPPTSAALEQSPGYRDPIVDPTSDDPTMSFADLLDMVNPLQHIPGISALYREITGDRIADGPRLVGDFLFGLYGGPATLAGTATRVLFEETTGIGVDSLVASAIGSDATAPAAATVDVAEPPAKAATADAPRGGGNAAALAALAHDLRSLALNAPPTATKREETNTREAAQPTHPFLPPAGASPEWYAQRMARALDKYRSAAMAAHPR